MAKSKKFVSLLSGGLDSPVATYLMMKKGYDCEALTFITGDDPNGENREKLIKIAKKIKELSGREITLYVAEHNSTVQHFIKTGIRKLTCVMCKRYMLLTARLLSHRTNAKFIVNGDILGEQASQTLDNLVQIQKILKDIPVIRPIIGFEKAEVIKKSQELGLYPLSSISTPSCEFNPKFPETHAKLKEIQESEFDVNYEEIAKKILNKAEKILI